MYIVCSFSLNVLKQPLSVYMAWETRSLGDFVCTYGVWEIDVTLNTMALICICKIHIFTDMSIIPMGSAGMLFCCSSNICALILSKLKGNLSVFLRDGWQNLCLFVCVYIQIREKHSLCQRIVFVQLPLMIDHLYLS